MQNWMTNMRALIIEDDETSRLLLTQILEPYATITTAEDGEDGFEQFSNALESDEPFDIVLLDLNMPRVDGHAVFVAIRELEEEHGCVGSDGVKVIITTAIDEPKSVYEANSKGCSAYLTKPLHRKQLLDELRRLKFLPEPH